MNRFGLWCVFNEQQSSSRVARAVASIALALGIVGSLGATQALAQSIKFEPGRAPMVTVVGTGFLEMYKGSFSYRVYVNGQQARSGMTSNGSFREENVENDGRGFRVRAEVDYATAAGRVFVREFSVAGAQPSPNPGSPPSPGVGPVPNPPSPGPSIPEFSEAEIRRDATRQAELTARRVARAYAAREQWRTSFVRGFRSAVELGGWDDYLGELITAPRRTEAYQAGLSEGERQGISAGNDAANRESEHAAKRGSSDAYARFEQALTGGGKQALDRELRVPSFQFQDRDGRVTSATPKLLTIEAALAALEGQFQREFCGIAWPGDDGYQLGWGRETCSWSLLAIYRYGASPYTPWADWTGGDWGFRRWDDERFGNQTSTIYYAMSETQKARFRQIFASAYANAVRENYFQRINNPDPTAVQVGRRYGQQVTVDIARSRGLRDGYLSSAQEAAERTFRRVAPQAYEQAFVETRTRHESGPVLEVKSVRIVQANEDGVYLPGESLAVELSQVRNLGLKPVDAVQVQLFASGVLQPGSSQPKSVRLDLAGLSAKDGAVRVNGVGVVSTGIRAGRRADASVVVGSVTTKLGSIGFGFDQALDQWERASGATAAGWSAYVLGQLRLEWSETIAIDDRGDRKAVYAKTFREAGRSQLAVWLDRALRVAEIREIEADVRAIPDRIPEPRKGGFLSSSTPATDQFRNLIKKAFGKR